MAHDNLNLLTIIVATYGKQEYGITISEIIEKSDGKLTKPTIHRLLKTIPGFKKAAWPVYPTGYYFDAKASGKDIDLTTDTRKKIKDPNKPYKHQTIWGPVENPKPLKELSTKSIIKTLVEEKDAAAFRKTIWEGWSRLEFIYRSVNSGDLTNAAGYNKEDKEDTLLPIIKARNAAYILYRTFEQILTDPDIRKSNPEWYKVFQESTE